MREVTIRKNIDRLVLSPFVEHFVTHKAVFVLSFKDGARFPNRAIAFQTRRFDWVYSAQDKNGKRKIIFPPQEHIP